MMRISALLLVTTATATSVWPAPSQMQIPNDATVNLVDGFGFTVSGKSTLLDQAGVQYTQILLDSGTFAPRNTTGLTQINIQCSNYSENLHFGVDETYTLTITKNSTLATIFAATPYGALHAMKTFV